jgi:hypothetical protein
MLRVGAEDARSAEIPECSASNRQLRMFVAGWMLGGTKESMREALSIYEAAGNGLLDSERQGRLTDEMITDEFRRLVRETR